MNNKNNKPVRLENLKEEWEKRAVPELPEIKLDNIAEVETQAEKISQAAKQVRVWVCSTLGQLDLAEKASRQAKELMAPKVAEARKGLDDLFGHELVAYRRAAWLGLFDYEFSKDLHSRQEVENLLEELAKKGQLQLIPEEETEGDGFKAYGKIYTAPTNAGFEEPEVKEVRKTMSGLLSRVFEETGKKHAEKAKDLRGQGSLLSQEFLAGKPGKYVLEVPAEKTVFNGRELWRGGGTLLVETDGEDVFPLDASGSIEGAMKKAKDLGVFLKFYTLERDRPPIVPNLDPERGKKVQLLWYLIKRASRAEEKSARLVKAKEALISRVTVSCQEFFLEQKPGICLAEFRGTWQNPDGNPGPADFLFLVERTKEEEGGAEKLYVRIVDVEELPNQLNGFFAQCLDKYVEKGNKFEGLPYPLRAVLMAIYGQVLKASQGAEKAEAIAK